MDGMTKPTTGSAPVASAGRFAWHVGEMMLAMYVGMAVLGGLWSVVLAAAGTSASDVLDTAPALVAIVLMFDMSVPMLAWMHYRGHPRAQLVEMAAAMGAVALVAIVLLSVSAIDNAGVCGVECALMVPATIAAMWPHRREYGMRGSRRRPVKAGARVPPSMPG